MKRLLLVVVLLSTGWITHAQNYNLSGYIKDAESGETLIGASVFAPETGAGTASNEYGFFSLALPANQEITVRISYTGYQTFEQVFNLKNDEKFDVELSSGETLQEVVVSAESNKEQVNSTQMSVTKLTTKEAKVLPALFGEVDILKTLQLKPGVTSGGEGTSGLYVRGGGADQNLFVLDDATVYNASHLFGFFSTFNSDAVKDIQLFKGGFPAQYGGRLSSVIDVKLNEGNRKKFSGKGGLGLISSRLTLEGPFDEGNGSFILSGRRTYADLITRQVNRMNQDNEDFNPIPDYFFYDFNTKANYDINENNKVFISGYFGRDKFKFDSDDFNFNFNWGNITTSARWNHIFSPRLFMNTTATFSDYDYTISNEFGQFAFELGSGIQDYALKSDFTYSPNNQHLIKFGATGVYHQFEVGRIETSSEDNTIGFNAGQEFEGIEVGAYISDDFKVNDKLTLNGGLRISGFQNDGEFYSAIEPRFATKYSIGENVSLKASYARMVQYIHLISSSGVSLPTDIWYPSDKVVKPQRSDQVAGGITFALGEEWILSNEVYYKWLDNQIDLKDNANLFANDNLNQEFVFGDGWSYGDEIYLEKTKGKLRGWVGYTLSWSWRQFDEILNGGKFPPRYDRRHDVSVVVMYELNDKFTLTGSWVYNTGNAISIPQGYFIVQEASGDDFRFVPIYSERNSYRMPSYHRMDLGFVWNFNPKWGSSDLTFSVYNAYDRRNPYFIYIDDNRSELIEDGGLTVGNITEVQFQAKQVSLFPVIPSITYNFEF